MQLKQLKHFLAVVEFGSLNRASDHLHLSQPAVSKSIQNLEAELGVVLLERGHRGMRPTAIGSALVQYAKLINAQVDHTQRQIEAMKGLSRGKLVFGVVPSLGVAVGPQAVAQILRKFPEVSIRMIEGFAPAMSAALLDGTVEFIVSPRLSELPEDEIDAELLFADTISIVCRRGQPLAKKRGLRLSHLQQSRWVLPSAPDAFREFVTTAFLAAGLMPPSPVFEANSMTALKAVVSTTDALTFLPIPAILEKDLLLTRLARSPIETERQMFIIRRRLSVTSPLAEAMMAALRTAARRMHG